MTGTDFVRAKYAYGHSTTRLQRAMRSVVPRGTLHSFKNEGTNTMRMALTFVPAGIEKYFEEVLEPVHDRSAAPTTTTKELIDRLLAAGPRYGIEFVLPGKA